MLVALLAAPASAHATRVRVVAATELRIDPRIDPSGEVTMAVRARDDHGQPVRGHIRLTITAPGRPVDVYERDNDAHDETRFVIARDPSQREFHAVAELVGTASVASARVEADIDLATPFVTVDLRVPPLLDITANEIQADVTLHVGEIVPANPSGGPVALYIDNDPNPRGAEVDETGLHAPGVITLHAAYARHGAGEIRSADRRVVLRAATRMTIARVPGDTNRIVGTVDTTRGPVARAAVRVFWNTRVVAAALTDEGGMFTVDLDPEVALASGVTLRATFEPHEPWLLPSSTPTLAWTLPEPRRVSWRWALVPLGAAVALLVALRLRRREPTDERASIPAPALGDAAVERVGDGRGARVKIVVLAEDRATKARIEGAVVLWRTPALGELPVADTVETTSGTRFDCEVRAPGYAPRTLAGEIDRGGEYHVRVPLRSWREELFERARTWMRRAGAMGSPALPTPREVLANRADDPDAAALVQAIEEGSYGPEAPDAEAVARADSLADDLESRRQRER